MDRRTAVKLGILSGSILAIPTSTSAISDKKQYNEPSNNSYLKIALGKTEIFIFSDGHVLLENPQPIFAPTVNSTDFTVELESLYLGHDKLDLAINIMVVKTDDKTILIDAGCGSHFNKNEGWLLENMQEAGIKADAVTDVFITHAHRDHIGGVITKNDKEVYTNAQYHMAKAEYDFWMSDKPDFSKSKLTDKQKKTSIDFTKRVLNSIKEKLNFFAHGDTLFSCLQTELADGHTPGHTIFTISSGGKSIKNIVDTVHSPLLIAKPKWGTQWDIDFERGIESRKRILEDCFKNRQLTMSSHLPWPGLGFIGKEKNYYWSPLSYATPNEIHL